MPRFELLVGSDAFWNAAREDIARATRRVLIQAMTFEGDAAGQGVAGAIAASAAADRRVLVDDYSCHVINDRLLAFAPRSSPEQVEAAATRAMFERLVASGAGVRVTNPVGRNPAAYATRNHKKLLVIDDAVWIGGINFSDHNFAWHDMMVRIDDAAVADFCAGTFEADWAGQCSAVSAWFPGVSLTMVDGVGNAALLQPVIDRLAGARRSIEMIGAYVTFPFVDAMAAAAARGVAVTLYTPARSNKGLVQDYLFGAAARGGIALRLLPAMTHVKAALVDGEELLCGSLNFDFVGYRASSEIVASITDAELVEQAETRLFAPLRAEARAASAADDPGWRGTRARAALRVADVFVSLLGQPKRVRDWV